MALASAAGLQVTAWHINHGLHQVAEEHAQAAKAIAERFGADFELRSVQLDTGPDLEARARAVRYELLPDNVMVGHTADDRAETVLFNIGRGGGLAGAAAPHRSVARPLLRLRRFETRALCQQLGINTVNDPMNNDPSFARVVIRNEVMPALAKALNRDPVPLLNRHADLASQALDAISQFAANLDPASATEITAAPVAVATEALRSWIFETVGTVPSAACIDRIRDVAAGQSIATEISGGHRVARTAQRLRIEPSIKNKTSTEPSNNTGNETSSDSSIGSPLLASATLPE